MARSITDARQVTLRQFLQQITNRTAYTGTADSKPANQIELDNLLTAISEELTPLLRMTASFPNDLVVSIGAGVLTNSESSFTSSLSHIATVLPSFTSGTVTFPVSSGGTITVSPGNNGILTVSSGNYIKVLIYMDTSGNLNVSSGVQNAVEASATVPQSPIDTLPLGYVTLQNSGGTIQNIAQNKIYQFPIGTGVRLTALDSEFVVKDSTDNTKQIGFDAAGNTNTKTTIAGSQTADRTVTLPDITDTLVSRTNTETLSNKQVQYSSSTDSTTTGSNATAQSFTTGIIRLTNSSLVSLSGIPAGSSGQFVIIENKTGNQITINNEEATATAANRIQTGTSANVSMPNNSTFMFTYDSTSSRWQLSGGSGSGSGSGGSKNYLSAVTTSQSTTPNTGNGDFETGSTTGWSLFNTTLTSGIPTGSISAGAASVTTFDTINTGHLAGGYSLRTASSGAWSAGQGFISDAMYIDNEDKGKVLNFKAYFECTANATNGNFSGTSSNTFAVYIYDVTNSAWIQPSGVYGITQNAGSGYVSGSFQATINSTQYRIAVLAVNASSGAITMIWDDFAISPSRYVYGTPVTDWRPYTPTIVGFGTPTNVAFLYRQVGDSYDIKGYLTSGVSTAVSATISLPNGRTANASVISNVNPTINGVGAVSTTGDVILLQTFGNSSNIFFGRQGASSTGTNQFNGNQIASSGQSISIELTGIPITGLSSSVQVSSETDTRVVAAKYTAVNTTTFTTSGTVCDWNTKVQDTHGAVTTGANWKFTAPVSGTYHVEVTAMRGGAIGIIFNLRKNGSSVQRIWQLLSVDNNASKNGSTTIELNAGDYIDLLGFAESSTTTLINDATLNSVSIFRLSGPSVIAASETVAAKVNASGGTTIAASSSDTKVGYNTVIKDTHGAFSTANNRFTAPISGWYDVKASVRFDTASWTANNRHEMLLYKNGVNTQYLKSDMMPTTSSYYPGSLAGATEIYLLAGDYLEIFVRQAEGTTRNLITDSTINFASFIRTGN